MSCSTRGELPIGLDEEEDQNKKPHGVRPGDVPLAIQLLLLRAFAYGQRNPIIAASQTASFEEWYEENKHKLPEELRARMSICDLWNYLMAKESE